MVFNSAFKGLIVYSAYCLEYGLDGRSTSVGKGLVNSPSVRTFVDPEQLPVWWIKQILSPEVQQQPREFDLSPPSVSRVKNERIYNSAPLCDLITDSGDHAILIVGLKPLGY
jgi:hypothetical protein